MSKAYLYICFLLILHVFASNTCKAQFLPQPYFPFSPPSQTQTGTPKPISISQQTGSLVGPDHTFTGFVKKLSSERIIHVFRLDPGDGGNHVGPNGSIAKRFSDDDGKTWSIPEIIYKDEYDDRVGSGGILDNGEIVVFFGRYLCYSAWGGVYIDINYISSVDNGDTWSKRQFIEPACVSVGLFDIFKIPGEKGYFTTSYGGYYVDIRYSPDGHNWDSIYTKWDFRQNRDLNITEPIFTPLGNGKIIGLFRVEKSPIHQTISVDNGKTWSQLEPTNLAQGMFCPYPFNVYDETLNKMVTIVCDRRGEDYDLNNFNSGIWVYCNDPDSIMNNAKSYSNSVFQNRANPNIFRFLGYPFATKTNDSTYIVLYTDSYKKPNNFEDADFYQFYVNIDKSVYIKKTDQTISVSPIHQISYDTTNVIISGFSSSNLPLRYETSDTTIVKIINNEISPVGVGTCEIFAFQDGNEFFKPATKQSFRLKVNKAKQIFDFKAPNLVFVNSQYIIPKIMTQSVLPVAFEISDTSVAKFENGKIKIVSSGVFVLKGLQNGNSFFEPSEAKYQTITVNKLDQSIDFDIPETILANQLNFDIVGSSSSGLPLKYSISDTSIVNIQNNQVQIKKSGICIVTAQQQGSSLYYAANPVVKTLNISKAFQSIDFQLQNIITADKSPLEITTFSSSGLPVIVYSSDTNIAVIKNGKIVIKNEGYSSITAQQIGNDIYYPASQVSQTVFFQKLQQYLYDSLPSIVSISDSVIHCKKYSSSHLDVEYISSDTSVIKVVNENLVIVGAGTSSITASQSGNDVYNSAIPISRVVTVEKLNQTIQCDFPSNCDAVQPFIIINKSSSSGLPVTVSISDTSIAHYVNDTLFIKGSGYCNIIAEQLGNERFNPAESISKRLTISKINQFVSVQIPNEGFVGDSSTNIQITSSSNLPVSFEIADTSIFFMKNNILYFKNAGNTTITFLQNGSNKYFPIVPISSAITVLKKDQIIEFELQSPVMFSSDSISLNQYSSSQLMLTYISSDTSIAYVTEGKLIFKKPGLCSITATQSGNEMYNPAKSIRQEIEITKLPQIITFDTIPDAVMFDNDFSIFASSNSGLPITLTSSDTTIAIIKNNVIHINGAGTCIISAKQDGNDFYNEALTKQQAFTVSKHTQNILFDSIPNFIFGDSDYQIVAYSSSDLPVQLTSSDTNVFVINDGRIVIKQPGIATVFFNQNGNENYFTADVRYQQVTIIKADQQISFDVLPEIRYREITIIPSCTVSSGLPIEYTSSDTSVAKIINGKIKINGAGTCLVKASQNGNTCYNPNESIQSLNVLKAYQTIPILSLPKLTEGNEFDGLSYGSSSGLPIHYTTSDSSILVIRDSKIIPIKSGKCIIYASQNGDNNFFAAQSISQIVTVNKQIKSSEPIVNEKQIVLYPNPVDKTFYIKTIEGANVSIIDSRGVILINKRHCNSITEFDISNLSSGIYFISIVFDNSLSPQFLQFVKE